MKMRSAWWRASRGQRGDTIVEVVIAIAVVSLVLTGAFVVTTQSQRDVRDSEEHSEALQLLQGQVELLRAAAVNTASGISTQNLLASPGFCLGPSDDKVTSSCTINSLYTLSIQCNSSQSDSNCTPCAPGAPANTTTRFDLTNSWPAISGGTDEVFLSYKTQVVCS